MIRPVESVEELVSGMQPEEKIDLLPPSADYVFKNVFAKETHKRALISLLNSILEGHPIIRDITIENPEIPRDFKKGKSVGLDIRATTDDKTKLQIDVQCQEDGRIANRSVFYQSKMQKNALKKNEEYDDLPNIISIWLVNYDETKRKYHTHEALYTFKKTPLDQPEIATDKFRTFIVELPKVDIKHAKVSDIFKVWVYFLRNPEKIPPEFLTIPEVKEAMEELRYVSCDPEVRRGYDSYIKWQNDQINARSHAFNKGKREGMTQGITQGVTQGIMQSKKETAQKLFSKGMTIEDIADVTGLSSKEIESLKSGN
jgi:predicted transposase/invertase (TIGR01784 family)